MKIFEFKTAKWLTPFLLSGLVITGCGGRSEFQPISDNTADTCPGVTSEVTFNGTNQYIDIGTISALSSAVTVEAWVYAESANTWSRIVDLGVNPTGNSVSENLFLGFYADTGSINLETKISQSLPPTQLVTTNTLPLNTWVHVAGTIMNDGSAKIYFNGIEQTSSYELGTAHTVNNVTRTHNYIGRSNYSADALFKGKIRDVRIWDESRTQTQIATGSNSPLTATDLSNPNRVCYTPVNKP